MDDDGTAYEWDPVARRFAEVGVPSAAAQQAAAADAAFDQEQQTFAFEAEEIPAMPEPEAVGTLGRRCLSFGLDALPGFPSQCGGRQSASLTGRGGGAARGKCL